MGLDCVYKVQNRIIPGGIDKASPAAGAQGDSSHALVFYSTNAPGLDRLEIIATGTPRTFFSILFPPFQKMNDGNGFSSPGKQSK